MLLATLPTRQRRFIRHVLAQVQVQVPAAYARLSAAESEARGRIQFNKLHECNHGGCADHGFKLVVASMSVRAAGARLNHFACAALGRYGKFFRQRCHPNASGDATVIVTRLGDVAERKVPPACVSVSRFVLPLTARVCFHDIENCVQQQ